MHLFFSRSFRRSSSAALPAELVQRRHGDRQLLRLKSVRKTSGAATPSSRLKFASRASHRLDPVPYLAVAPQKTGREPLGAAIAAVFFQVNLPKFCSTHAGFSVRHCSVSERQLHPIPLPLPPSTLSPRTRQLSQFLRLFGAPDRVEIEPPNDHLSLVHQPTRFNH